MAIHYSFAGGAQPKPVGILRAAVLSFPIEVSMADYRLFFLGSDGAIEARHDFSAPDDRAALQIMAVIAQASDDSHHGVMLWQGTRRIGEAGDTGPAASDTRPAGDGRMAAADLAAAVQDYVVECEETLLNSHWRLAKSLKLLEATNELRRECRGRGTKP